MDYDFKFSFGDKNENASKREEQNGENHKIEIKKPTKQVGDTVKYEGEMESSKKGSIEQNANMKNSVTGEVNMEAVIKTDDVVRAGGFGATDDIGSLLPVAVDSTDFEASLRDARDFEEPQGETLRPGLGWTEPNA
ncbi:hypothetical protein IHE45_07G065800 [Dioscorea alata]|uniref:Uncharacterized protein n=4 Tax=Dioscorea alata TaxID=55571 RepID=A0ACB7VSA4_DIOAL|nr:hypothetical protein IHE45_07G065800 [Dioscorea alata]KAH7677182.1 hypothetical protein IHE45_07G065800 [Dioscorea alata]KAH7677183.1 hypothetical protein IHE45_07G065800 [Dioscorea alata]KAH7677184.1 hypothetical protein IHE45_07G065800 [Dioscorea alata]